jgi:hypothetical protein
MIHTARTAFALGTGVLLVMLSLASVARLQAASGPQPGRGARAAVSLAQRWTRDLHGPEVTPAARRSQTSTRLSTRNKEDEKQGS